MSSAIPSIPIFDNIRVLTEEEERALNDTKLIRDDFDIEFEEKLAKATKNAKQESNVDIPSYLRNTNAL